MFTKLPLYFRCLFFDKKNKKVVSVYKIDATDNRQYPFQLFKRVGEGTLGWMNLSIYASMTDSVGVLLKELFTKELSEEIYHGQAFIDPATILKKIIHGDRSIAIYDDINHEAFRLEYDIDFQELVQHTSRASLRPRKNIPSPDDNTLPDERLK